MKYTIQDLSDGKVAVVNDGTVEELREVLKLAFPEDKSNCHARNKCYIKNTVESYMWGITNSTDLPTQSVKEFLKQEEIIKFNNENFDSIKKMGESFDKTAASVLLAMMGKDDTAINPSHYTKYVIQPIEFIEANKIDFATGNVIKYVCRSEDKNGLEDLKKAQFYLQLLIDRYEK